MGWKRASSRQPSNIEASFDGSQQDGEAANTIKMIIDAFEIMMILSLLKLHLKMLEKPLFPSCVKFTKLSALLRIYNIKGKNRWSDKSFLD